MKIQDWLVSAALLGLLAFAIEAAAGAPEPPRNLLLARRIDQPEAAPEFVGAIASENLCWQVAKVLTSAAQLQVFYCVSERELPKQAQPKGARS